VESTGDVVKRPRICGTEICKT